MSDGMAMRTLLLLTSLAAVAITLGWLVMHAAVQATT